MTDPPTRTRLTPTKSLVDMPPAGMHVSARVPAGPDVVAYANILDGFRMTRLDPLGDDLPRSGFVPQPSCHDLMR